MADIENGTNYSKIKDFLGTQPDITITEQNGIWINPRKGCKYLSSEINVTTAQGEVGAWRLANAMLTEANIYWNPDEGLSEDRTLTPVRLRSFDQLSERDFRVILVIINPASKPA